MQKIFLPILFYITFSIACQAQTSYFEKIELLTDTSLYSSKTDYITVNGIKRIYFSYTSNAGELEVRVFPGQKAYKIGLVPSRDYDIIDSILKINGYFRFKVKFRNITQSELLRFTFEVESDSVLGYEDVYLQPVTNTTASIYISDDQLFIGEEKIYEVISNNLQNLNISGEWVNTDNFDYRFNTVNEKIYLHLVPKKLGEQKLIACISAIKPHLNKFENPEYKLPPIETVFNVKASRLQYLNLDKPELTFSEDTRLNGIEVQIENSRLLQMLKTYRIEAQEEPGGALIAEMFTKQRLANNKVLCVFRPYNLHRVNNGYLYLKDGDAPQFITNVNITPATQIEKISILNDGSEWRESRNIHPGQTFDLKLEGKGLHKAKFRFEDLVDLTSDTLIRSENEIIFKLRVPHDITKKRITIYNFNNPTGQSLNVIEYQRPRELDFVFLNYGDFGRRVSGIKEPILYDDVIKNLTISFNTDKIDDEKLYGKQYLNVKVQITGKKNELIELKTIENIAVCPSGQSPRSSYYSAKDCFNGDISLNKYIRRPTYTLDEWSRINLIIEHDKSKHGGEGYMKEIDVILKRKYSFDVEVSFPAGLLTIYPKDTVKSLGNLSGISMAMIAQFSFYHPEKINTYRPYKIGAGFLALNAFNMSSGMDLSLVVLGSVYPTTRDTKLSFPLYAGMGYALSKNDVKKTPGERFFFMVGPGIRVRF
ncbi:MAG: hypothetical protein JXB34_08965 [Bacteroidales bacterium]|nr:hypothetical protein [Bacteroidales bacterium]